MRKATLLAMLALVAVLATGVMPAGAAPGAGAGLTVLSPLLDNGFPCQGGGGPVVHSFQKWIANQPGLDPSICTGSIYTAGGGAQNSASFAGAGVAGQPYSIAGTGSISGAYLYSEPCQATPAGNEAGTGEAYGTLTLTLNTAIGNFGATPITNGSVKVNFWWSRVGLTAIVGIRGVELKANNGAITVNDANALGAAAAIFIPASAPNCNQPGVPGPGAINILSGTLTAGSPA
jgi:hypothetical protein